MKWTHIRTRTPDSSRIIIAYSAFSGEMHTAFYVTQGKQFFTNTIHEKKLPHTTHWAELPKPPK